MSAALSRRSLLATAGALVVGFAHDAGAQTAPANDSATRRTLDPNEVDGFFSVNADGTVTLFCGKVDLGTGLRIAIPQMAAEELGIAVERIRLVEGDSALTPDQGPTAGSTGIMRGGVQIRQAAATAREVLLRLAAERFKTAPDEWEAVDGEVRRKSGALALSFAAVIGERRFAVKLDPKAPLKSPDTYRVVGQPLPRPDVPAKVTGTHRYMQDFTLPGMLHGRVIRPPAINATLAFSDSNLDAIVRFPFVRTFRINNFLGVVGNNEWETMQAARLLKPQWSGGDTLMGHNAVEAWMQSGPFSDQELLRRGDVTATLAAGGTRVAGSYYWPLQSHASMGPSCAVADVRENSATIWTASQASHRLRLTLARILGLQPATVRTIYLDGAGCYGMNGHDDAAADAALLSRAAERPVRVQWSREDELGWDPKGPPQLLSLQGTLGADGSINAWRTEMWLPRATANLPNIPLLGPQAAGIEQVMGLSTGLISQNGDPPYAVPNLEVLVHWLKDSPLRPSNIRAPGKIANSFAVESFVDELAAAGRRDPLDLRLQGLRDPRGLEVLKRTAAMLGWTPRPSPGPGGIGRGIAYVHYKHSETYVAIGMEVEVERSSGAIKVRRVVCAQDCGLVINPDTVRQQVEGNILQTLSRTWFEEVTFDDRHVTSTDWISYPILAMPDVPDIRIELVRRQHEPPLGVGEAAAAPVAAAFANAIFDASGARLRKVPFTPQRVKEALARAGT